MAGKGCPPLTPFQIETIRLLYSRGMSSPRIGALVGIGGSTVIKYCHGIVRPGPITAGSMRDIARQLIIASGISLTSGQHVHHKDGNPFNNAMDNLEVMEASVHGRQHATKSNSPWEQLSHIAPEDREHHYREYQKIWRARPENLAKKREYRRKQALAKKKEV